MKIAVTYENGNVFQHFGHTEAFKVYDIEDGKIKSSEVIPTNGSGHGALAGFLKDLGVSTLELVVARKWHSPKPALSFMRVLLVAAMRLLLLL